MKSSLKAIIGIAAAVCLVSLSGCSALQGISGGAGIHRAASIEAGPAHASTPTAATPSATIATPGANRPAAPTEAVRKTAVPSPATARYAVPACAAGVLTGRLAPGSGGAAGSTESNLILTNRGSGVCTLQGWPGVSFVGDGNGTQIGAAAQQLRSAPHPTVTLTPGRTVEVPIKIAQAVDFPARTCQPVAIDGLRVYPPASRTALFVRAAGLIGCRNAAVTLLTVSAVIPEN